MPPMKNYSRRTLRAIVLNSTNPLHRETALFWLIKKERDETRERVGRVALAMYCQATGKPKNEETRQELMSESAAMLAERHVDSPDFKNGCPVCGGPDWPNCHGRVISQDDQA